MSSDNKKYPPNDRSVGLILGLRPASERRRYSME